MRVLVVGGSGLIGGAVVEALEDLDHDVITASLNHGDLQVDVTSTDSIEKMYQEAGAVDAVVSTTGRGVPFKKIFEMDYEDFEGGFQEKLLGQINLVLVGQHYLNSSGSFTLTSGILNHAPIPMGSCAATVNSALEGFVKSAALELPKKMRLNLVSPDLITEAKSKYHAFFKGFEGVSLKKVAPYYIRSVEGILNGSILKVFS